MKNILIYVGPQKKFTKEDVTLAKIQIDNSFDLGWGKKDIIIASDFHFAYNGIKSFTVPNNLYYSFDVGASKVPVLIYLIQVGVITRSEICWCHDFDAYENNRINEGELGLENYDLGFTHYFYKPQWQFGSVFLKNASKDILELLHGKTLERPYSSRNNEKWLTWLIKKNLITKSRYKKMNVTYNITKKYLQTVYKEAIKPLKVLHFRPSDKDVNTLDIFMYGKNRLQIPLMSERLIKIFKHHGTK